MLHLVTLKLITQRDLHSCKESRSRWSVIVSSRDDIVLYRRRTDGQTNGHIGKDHLCTIGKIVAPGRFRGAHLSLQTQTLISLHPQPHTAIYQSGINLPSRVNDCLCHRTSQEEIYVVQCRMPSRNPTLRDQSALCGPSNTGGPAEWWWVESRMNGPRESHVVGKSGHYVCQGGPWHDYKLYAP